MAQSIRPSSNQPFIIDTGYSTHSHTLSIHQGSSLQALQEGEALIQQEFDAEMKKAQSLTGNAKSQRIHDLQERVQKSCAALEKMFTSGKSAAEIREEATRQKSNLHTLNTSLSNHKVTYQNKKASCETRANNLDQELRSEEFSLPPFEESVISKTASTALSAANPPAQKEKLSEEKSFFFPPEKVLKKCLEKQPGVIDYHKEKEIPQRLAEGFANSEKVEGGIKLGTLLTLEDNKVASAATQFIFEQALKQCAVQNLEEKETP